MWVIVTVTVALTIKWYKEGAELYRENIHFFKLDMISPNPNFGKHLMCTVNKILI